MRKLWPLTLFLAPGLLAVFFGWPLLLFAACLLAGFTLTYWSGLDWRFEERFVFGALLGALSVSVACFAISWLIADVTLLSVGAGAALALALGAVAAFRSRVQLFADTAALSASWRSLWPMTLLSTLCAAWTLHFFAQAYVYLPTGLYAGYINIWGDWAAHLAFTGSFAYGHNFPPQFPIDPGNHLGYPFMVDFFAALSVPLGASLTSALVLTSSYLALFFPPLFYLLVARFTQVRLAAFLAPLIFFLSGGLGFVYLLQTIDTSGFSALLHLPHEYTLNRTLNYQWLNPVLAYLVPQRSSLFGFPLFLLLLMSFQQTRSAVTSWRTFAFLGVLAGLLPAFHVHAYLAVLGVTALWSLFMWRRALAAFFVPALALGLPVLAWMWPPANNLGCGVHPVLFGYCFQPGWLAWTDWHRDGLGALTFLTDVTWFWLKNTSIFIPLLVTAHYLPKLVPPSLLKWFLPLWFWFIVPNLFILQPWDWDNTKWFILFFLFGSVFVGLLLANLALRSHPGAVLAVVCFGLLVFSGSLDLARASDSSVSSNQFIDERGLVMAAWVRTHTPPDAIFATATNHNSPLSTLSGRRILVGYPGWLWTYGQSDYAQKGADETAILQGTPTAPTLVTQYHISYVLIGPQELASPFNASRDYWNAHAKVVYGDGEYTLYQIN